ncbi:MAG: lysozyme inhibitor LprI family protein [Luteolibacter sp.]
MKDRIFSCVPAIIALVILSPQISLGQSQLLQSRRVQMSDAKLNATYRVLLGYLNDRGKELLKTSQRSWIDFRDAESLLASGLNHTSQEEELARLTSEREKVLASMVRKITGLRDEEPTAYRPVNTDSSTQSRAEADAILQKARAEAAEILNRAKSEALSEVNRVKEKPAEGTSAVQANGTSEEGLKKAREYDAIFAKASDLLKEGKYSEATTELTKVNTNVFKGVDESLINDYTIQKMTIQAAILGAEGMKNKEFDDSVAAKIDPLIENVVNLIKDGKNNEAKLELLRVNCMEFKDIARRIIYEGRVSQLKRMIDGEK